MKSRLVSFHRRLSLLDYSKNQPYKSRKLAKLGHRSEAVAFVQANPAPFPPT
ncbi:hypothetical protein [Burkholderia ambifaria]|uniref:hypothetical protein n=1 Tax=Burkholderia ambifaria TaxID=152480 RepID=UPI00158C7DF0|nr:hypothetical protein [Burkholderia ambifaria]